MKKVSNSFLLFICFIAGTGSMGTYLLVNKNHPKLGTVIAITTILLVIVGAAYHQLRYRD